MYFENALKIVSELVNDFKANESHYLSSSYQEADVRNDFINKFFIALGWDVRHEIQKNPYEQEVRVEKPVQIAKAQKRADYSFSVAPNFRTVKFFVEAKKPSHDLENKDYFFQTVRYGWNANTPIAVLTDFEEFIILDCRFRPDINDILNHKLKSFHYTEYADEEKLKEIYYLFSREAVADNSIEKFIESLPKPRGKKKDRVKEKFQNIDEAFLEELDEIRTRLAKSFKKNNYHLSSEELTEATQRTIDRLVFIRFLEDKLIEPHHYINEFGRRRTAWEDFHTASRKLDAKYNGVVFKKNFIDSRNIVEPDEKIFASICEELSHENSPYNFDAIPIHILGSIYERFLGKVVNATDKRVTIEEKPEVRKAGGVYYTPQYIVNYIVDNTVVKLINGKTPKEITKMRFADIACGSGSFLITVYERLIDYHKRWYQQHPEQAKKDGCILYEGAYRLSLQQKQKILLNNIYGVDLDQQAVEVTQLSLYLKLLEDETTATANDTWVMFKEQLLPDLNKNIVCGNSLIGTDIFEGNLFDFNQEKKLKPMDFETIFPDVMRAGGFDAVVGNPPYVRSKILPPDERVYYSKKFMSATGTFDIYILFIEQAFNLIKPKGKIGYITPNKYFFADYGKNLRSIIGQYRIEKLLDFNEYQVFKKITTYTAINIFEKNKQQSNFDYTVVEEKKTPEEIVKNYLGRNELDEMISTAIIKQESLKTEMWNFVDVREQSVNEKIWSNKKRLIDLCYKIYQGFVLTPTEVFPVQIINDGKAEVTIKPIKKDDNLYRIEKDLLIGIIKSSDIRKYHLVPKNYYSIFPYKYISKTEARIIEPEEMEREFPKTLAYLKEKKNSYLTKREKGRWKNSKYWYEFSRSQNFDCQKMEKIVVPGLATEARYSLADDSIFIDQGSYGIVLKNEYHPVKFFLLGLLNSSLLDHCLKSISGTLSGGYYSYQSKYLSRLPIIIPDIDDEFQRNIYNKIIELVTTSISSSEKLQLAKTESDKNYLTRKCETLDKQIDELVYELYGLTEEEIKIVEGD